MILCFSKKVRLTKWNKEDTMWQDALSFNKRKQEIADFYTFMEDVLRITRGYPGVKFRHIIAPTENPPDHGFVPIFATVENIKAEIDLGYRDGIKAIEMVKEKGSSIDIFFESMETEIKKLKSSHSPF